jgi:hypothetical protein
MHLSLIQVAMSGSSLHNVLNLHQNRDSAQVGGCMGSYFARDMRHFLWRAQSVMVDYECCCVNSLFCLAWASVIFLHLSGPRAPSEALP